MKKFHKVIKLNQNTWLSPYINMNTKLRQKTKNNFEKYFSKLMNNAAFGKTMQNVTKYQTCKPKKEKKLFSIRTELSYCKVCHSKVISNGNEENSSINE